MLVISVLPLFHKYFDFVFSKSNEANICDLILMGVGVFCSVIFSNFAFCQGQSALPQHPHRLASHAPSQELLNALTKTSSTTIMEAHLPAAVVDATLIWCALLTQAPSLESGSKSSPHCVLLMAAAIRVSKKN